MTPHPHPGLLITFEGIDGAGKTTLLSALAKHLQNNGHTVITTKEPGGTFIGRMLKKVLLEEKKAFDPRVEFLLFAADRAEHFKTVVIPALQEGSIVLSDRMADSAVAYQGFGRQLDVAFIKQVNRFAMRDLTPDRTFYVRVPYETALQRRAQRNEQASTMEQEEALFWQRVITGYEELAQDNERFVTLDGEQTSAALSAEVKMVVEKMLTKKQEIIFDPKEASLS
ncbi:MAG: dTMP kinase [Candidatus Dependentiae bacterium]|jgi:dTMP kinase